MKPNITTEELEAASATLKKLAELNGEIARQHERAEAMERELKVQATHAQSARNVLRSIADILTPDGGEDGFNFTTGLEFRLERLPARLEDLRNRVTDCHKQVADAIGRIDRVAGERDHWKETAKQHARNEEFYRDLLDKVAAHLGPDVFVSDDGSVQDSPVRLKIPALVERLAGEVKYLNRHIQEEHVAAWTRIQEVLPEKPLEKASSLADDVIECILTLRRENETLARNVPFVTEWKEACSRGLRAICLTRDYVGEGLLPAIEGWDWFDAGRKLAALVPDDEWAAQFHARAKPKTRHEAIRWNPGNLVVQDHRDGTVIQPDTDNERAKRGLPPFTPEPRQQSLRDRIKDAINRVSAENESDTPDFILADFLMVSLDAFDAAVRTREKWYGRGPKAEAAATDFPAPLDDLHTTEVIGQAWCRCDHENDAPPDALGLKCANGGWIVLCEVHRNVATGALTYTPLARKDLPDFRA